MALRFMIRGLFHSEMAERTGKPGSAVWPIAGVRIGIDRVVASLWAFPAMFGEICKNRAKCTALCQGLLLRRRLDLERSRTKDILIGASDFSPS